LHTIARPVCLGKALFVVLLAVGMTLGLGAALAPKASAGPSDWFERTSCQTYGPKIPGNIKVPVGLLCQTIHVKGKGSGAPTIKKVEIAFGQTKPDECGYWADFDVYNADTSTFIFHDQGEQLPCKNTIGTPFNADKTMSWTMGGAKTLKGCTTLWRRHAGGEIEKVTSTCSTFKA
jgi:hypothetical protein